MKKLFASVATVALLAACAQEAAEEAPAGEEVAEVVTDANGETMEAYTGDWDVAMPDGNTAVTTNNADGTYTQTMADGTVIEGTWEFGAEQSCWTATDEEPVCYTVGAGDENGTRELTMADGTIITVTPKAAEAEAAEETAS